MPELPDLDLWLTAEDVGEGTEVEFVDKGEATEIPTPQGVRAAYNITVKLANGEKRSWTINKTSQRAIAKQYGINTDKWVGKKVKLKVFPQNVRGTMRDVVYVEGAKAPKIKDVEEEKVKE